MNVGSVCGSLPGTFGIRKDGRRERGVGVGSGEAGESSNACAANMDPENFKKSLWLKNRHMFIEAPRDGI